MDVQGGSMNEEDEALQQMDELFTLMGLWEALAQKRRNKCG